MKREERISQFKLLRRREFAEGRKVAKKKNAKRAKAAHTSISFKNENGRLCIRAKQKRPALADLESKLYGKP